MFIPLYLFLKILELDKPSKMVIKFLSTPIKTVFPEKNILLLYFWECKGKWIHQCKEINFLATWKGEGLWLVSFLLGKFRGMRNPSQISYIYMPLILTQHLLLT